jgi:hypothetical protein
MDFPGPDLPSLKDNVNTPLSSRLGGAHHPGKIFLKNIGEIAVVRCAIVIELPVGRNIDLIPAARVIRW